MATEMAVLHRVRLSDEEEQLSDAPRRVARPIPGPACQPSPDVAIRAELVPAPASDRASYTTPPGFSSSTRDRTVSSAVSCDHEIAPRGGAMTRWPSNTKPTSASRSRGSDRLRRGGS